jgi:hypothetical protein
VHPDERLSEVVSENFVIRTERTRRATVLQVLIALSLVRSTASIPEGPVDKEKFVGFWINDVDGVNIGIKN